MAIPTSRSSRRTNALSRERIVEAAIDILDSAGEIGLTVRAVTDHLSTGRGAIYHYVAGKDELLAAAVDRIVGHVLVDSHQDADSTRSLRALAVGIFNAIDMHPWVGTHLSREPFQPAVLRIWSGVGTQLQRLGVSGTHLSDAGAALVNYVLGAAAQYAAGARHATDDAARAAFLAELATQWTQSLSNPISHQAASLLHHDDRAQFLAGVDIVLAGITSINSGLSDHG